MGDASERFSWISFQIVAHQHRVEGAMRREDTMDAYCERVGMGILAEPLNAFSNVSLLLAAWAAWVLAGRVDAFSVGVRELIALGASVGVGSILWHTVPTMLTLILDIVPILIFICWFIWLYTRNVPSSSARSTTRCVPSCLSAPISSGTS